MMTPSRYRSARTVVPWGTVGTPALVGRVRPSAGADGATCRRSRSTKLVVGVVEEGQLPVLG